MCRFEVGTRGSASANRWRPDWFMAAIIPFQLADFGLGSEDLLAGETTSRLAGIQTFLSETTS